MKTFYDVTERVIDWVIMGLISGITMAAGAAILYGLLL